MEFYKLTIKKIIKETIDAVSIEFLLPTDLAPKFTFKPGQYLVLKHKLNGEELRRSYSICTAPFENILKVAIKKIEGGLFSTFAVDQLKEGDVIEVTHPQGSFGLTPNSTNKENYVFFAAGSGITPIISNVKSILKEEAQSNVYLYYGNKTQDNTIFYNELESLKAIYSNLHIQYFFSQDNSLGAYNSGRIDEAKLSEIVSKDLDNLTISDIMTCGPEQMIHNVSNLFTSKGVDEKNIHFELFTTPTTAAPNADHTNSAAETTIETGVSKVTVIMDDEETTFDLDYKGKNILDLGLDLGADLPFSCKGGVCCSCKAKVTEGKVHMDVNYALEQDEVDEGYVLACQCHPRSERVVLNFDEY